MTRESLPAASALARTRALEICAELVRLGARPSVAAAVTGVKNRAACEIYRQVTGLGAAPGGRLPSSEEWVTHSCERRLHASAFLRIHELLGTERDAALRLLSAYEGYSKLWGEALVDINRAVSLVQLHEHQMLEFVTCVHCRCQVVRCHGDIMESVQCPMCMQRGGFEQDDDPAWPSAANG